MREYRNRPGIRELLALQNKVRYADPKIRNRILKKQRAYYRKPGIKEAHALRFKKYYANPENRNRILARSKESWKKYRAKPGFHKLRNLQTKQRRKNPIEHQKYLARMRVYYAVKSGKITKQPCVCGNTKSQAHHSDYSKPLQIKWLCIPCHQKEHLRLRRIANALEKKL